MKKGQSFDEAMAELQAIVQKMEANDTNIDALAAHVKRAQELVAFCKKKLLATETEVKKLTEEQD